MASNPDIEQTTGMLLQMSSGDESAAGRLMPLVYDRFRSLARSYLARKPFGIAIQPTELVHEAFLKLVDQKRVDWKCRSHFFAIGAIAMRRILVDEARSRVAQKRGGEFKRVEFDEALGIAAQTSDDLLAIEDALKRLASLDARQAKIVELRFFAGMTAEEIGSVVGLSRQSVQDQWRFARAWLRKELVQSN